MKLDAKPFLSWFGGKQTKIKELIQYIPDYYNTYHEPFVGAGTVYFTIQPKHSFISDNHSHLIDTYYAIRDNPVDVYNCMEYHINTYYDKKDEECYFHEIKESYKDTTDLVERTGKLIFLNKLSFGSVMRFKEDGDVIISYGRVLGTKNKLIYINGQEKRKIYSPTLQNIVNCSVLLKQTNISCRDYSCIDPKENDFVYLDPPYYNTHHENYVGGFGKERQIELAGICQSMTDKGVYWMQSNIDSEYIRELYPDCYFQEINVIHRMFHDINIDKRHKEVIIRNYKHEGTLY